MATVAESLEAAVAHHRQGRFEQADRLYRAVLRVDPAHPDALHLMGVAAYQRGMASPAVDYLERAVTVRPTVAAYHSSLGAALRLSGKLEQAVESYRRAIELAPEHAGAHYNLGVSLEKLGRIEEAVDAYGKAIHIAPDLADAYINLGNLLQAAGKFESAIGLFRIAVDIHEEHPEFHYNLGNAQRLAGRTDEAIVELRRALILKPDHTDALNNLGILLKEQGEIDEAIACFEETLRIDPRHHLAQANLGSTLQLQQRYAESLDSLRAAWELLPDDPDIAAGYARELQRHHRFGEASELFDDVLASHPHHPRAWFGTAAIQLMNGELDAAAESFSRGLDSDPDDAFAWRTLARIRSGQGNVAEAEQAWRRAVELGSDPAEARLQLGVALLYAGRTTEGHAALGEVVRMDPQNALAWNNLGNAANALGRIDEATRCYEKSLELDPESPATRCNLAEMFRAAGRLEEAARQFRRGFDSPMGPRMKLQEAMLLPQLYESPAELEQWRERIENRIDGLLAEEFTYDPSRGIAPQSFYIAYQGREERELLERIDRLYRPGRLPEPGTAARSDGDGRIHIGFLSQHFRNHTISHLMLGLIAGLPRDRFHVTVFSHVPHEDACGRRIRESCDDYVVLTEHIPLAVRRVVDRRLDVLFYPDIGMDGFTNALARCRLAPVQCTTWGHPVTTGTRTIDYFLSSRLVEPDDAADHYTERLVQLETLPACIERPESPGKRHTKSDFGLPENRTLYCCPQSLFKFHTDFDRLLAEIVHRDPNACIAVIGTAQEKWNDILRRRLAQAAPDAADRVHFLRRLASDDFRDLLTASDVLLDTIHFGGGKTSYEALGLGVPIVTWPGLFARGRVTSGLYRKMGMDECIAGSAEEYVDLAVRLGTEPDFANHVRHRIRSTSDALFDDAQAIHEIGDFLQQAVNGEVKSPAR